MKDLFKQLLEEIGEDVNRPGLESTPKRAAKAIEFLTEGYHKDINEVINEALFPSDNDSMVIVRNIEFYSLCEHHILPFFGKVHVAYIPNGKVLGLSKIPRIVDIFARRLQIQESLCLSIAEAILSVTGGQGVAVVMEAQHMCMMMRGVEKQDSKMTTSSMLGVFRDNAQTRNEFLQLLQLK